MRYYNWLHLLTREYQVEMEYIKWQRQQDREWVDYLWGDLVEEENARSENTFYLRQLFGLEPYEVDRIEDWN